jgi:hypothetical protein
VPIPINTVTEPELRIRYWLPPNVLDTACTGVGTLVAAVKATVFPEGQKGAFTLMFDSKEEEA